MNTDRQSESGFSFAGSSGLRSGLGGGPVSRRAVLRCGLFGAAGVLLADRLGLADLPAPS
ncbi:unnamed protein product, partial [marine sediment metagenome]